MSSKPKRKSFLSSRASIAVGRSFFTSSGSGFSEINNATDDEKDAATDVEKAPIVAVPASQTPTEDPPPMPRDDPACDPNCEGPAELLRQISEAHPTPASQPAQGAGFKNTQSICGMFYSVSSTTLHSPQAAGRTAHSHLCLCFLCHPPEQPAHHHTTT